MPLPVSRYSPRNGSGGQLALIDPTGIAARMESIEVASSKAATIEATDDPTGASDAPAAQWTTPIALFQTGTVAFRATIHANWELQRTGAVALVTGCDYVTLTAPAS